MFTLLDSDAGVMLDRPSRAVAILLALLFGWTGAHWFYLGRSAARRSLPADVRHRADVPRVLRRGAVRAGGPQRIRSEMGGGVDRRSALTDRTVVGRSARLCDPPDGSAASRLEARLALTLVDPESGTTIGSASVVCVMARRKTVLMARASASAAGRGTPRWCGDGRGPLSRRDARQMQRLARVDVADSGDHSLVEQCHFDRRRLSGARIGQRPPP